MVVVRRGLRREPRHARDDRDPEGEARVPVSAPHADPGKERQGLALPADPPRRDDPRPHQPRGIPQVPAGKRERSAARPDGHHPGPVHAQFPRRGADLPEAHLERAGVRRSASRPARAAYRRGVRDPHAAARRRERVRRVEESPSARRRGRRRHQPRRSRAHPREAAGRSADRHQPALRDQRAVERDRAELGEEPDHDGRAARAQGRDRVRRAHRPEEEAQVGRLPGASPARISTTSG